MRNRSSHIPITTLTPTSAAETGHQRFDYEIEGGRISDDCGHLDFKRDQLSIPCLRVPRLPAGATVLRLYPPDVADPESPAGLQLQRLDIKPVESHIYDRIRLNLDV